MASEATANIPQTTTEQAIKEPSILSPAEPAQAPALGGFGGFGGRLGGDLMNGIINKVEERISDAAANKIEDLRESVGTAAQATKLISNN
ncbi:MAG: hypothetical protein Q8S21_01455 [Candidatus Paracaedibacteraceae bacterium]|nr:hypothetical protein [Candidatus Paracaedibacteraceae bacterium]